MKTYIYTLADPRDPNVIRYVGKSLRPEDRVRGHVRTAMGRRGEYPLAEWIRGLYDAGLTPALNIVSVHDDDEWIEAERAAICAHREAGHPIFNRSRGGERGGRYAPGDLVDVSAEIVMARYQGTPFPLSWREAVYLRMRRLGWNYNNLADSVGISRITLHRHVGVGNPQGMSEATPLRVKRAVESALANAEAVA